MAVYNIGFVIEQALGHVTHTKNLQQNIPLNQDVKAHWGLIPYETSGLASRIPIYRSNWTIRAGLRARRSVAQLARSAQLDALFFHTQVPAILATDWLQRIPSIVSLDATPIQIGQLGPFYEQAQLPAWLEHFKWQLNYNCYHAAQHLVTWSSWAKQGLIDGYSVPADKITIIPPGVNVKDWMRPTPRILHESPAKILFVGANLERKGGFLLLQAFRALRPLGIELHIVTKDHIEPEPGLFVYHGMQPNSTELKALYHACDIFALPTSGDCLPMVLSEASAAGMAVVSTSLAAIPEIIRNGQTGITIPVGNESALEQALQLLILKPELRLQLGEQAIEHAVREYDSQKNTSRLLDLIKDEVDMTRTSVRIPV